MAEKRRRIVILGGGFAGVYAAKYLIKELRRAGLKDVEVALVSRENYLTFQPLLPEVVAGGVDTLHTISPIRRVVPGASVYVRGVEEIDLEKKIIWLESGYLRRRSELAYDHLVLAMGNRLATGMVPGLAEHAVPFKYLGDALLLRNHLVHALEEAAITTDPAERQRLLTFVVAGGGFSGVECIAEMHDFLRHAVKSYSTINPSDLSVILLQSGETILPEMKPSLAQFAHRVLVKRGIRIDCNTRLSAVTATEAITRDKASDQVRAIGTRTVVATVPVEPHPLLSSLKLTQARGKIVVNHELHCAEAPNVWAIGDCAAVPLLKEGSFAPPTAQHAVRQGKFCAHNIVASMVGRPLKPYAFESLGALASLGRRSAVAEVMGIRLSGFLAWIMWRGIYLSKFPGWERKIRIFVDWMMDLLLPRDVTELRIFRAAPVRREHFEPGEVIFLKDDLGDRVYFVVQGEAEIEVGDRSVIATAGDVIGEIALISNRPRSATVRAKTPLDVVSVRRETFDTLVAHFPGVKAAMHQIMERHTSRDAKPASAEPAPAEPAVS